MVWEMQRRQTVHWMQRRLEGTRQVDKQLLSCEGISTHLQGDLNPTTQVSGATPKVSKGGKEGEQCHVVRLETL